MYRCLGLFGAHERSRRGSGKEGGGRGAGGERRGGGTVVGRAERGKEPFPLHRPPIYTYRHAKRETERNEREKRQTDRQRQTDRERQRQTDRKRDRDLLLIFPLMLTET